MFVINFNTFVFYEINIIFRQIHFIEKCLFLICLNFNVTIKLIFVKFPIHFHLLIVSYSFH